MKFHLRSVLWLGLFTVSLTSCGPEMVRSFFPDGKVMAEGLIDRRQQTGPWIYYYPSGAKEAEGGWVGDKQDGPWMWWYADGSPRYAGSYADKGLRTGQWQAWHPSGKLASSGVYRLDRQDGVWNYQHPNGAPAASGTFDFGVQHGYWLRRTSDGAPQAAGLYLKGLRVGPWMTWKNGVVTVEDVGVPVGYAASWEGRTWVLRGPGSAQLSFSDAGQPVSLVLTVDGREVTALPQDLTGVQGDLAALLPPVAPADSTPAPVTPVPVAPAPVALTTVTSPVPPSAPVVAANEAQIEMPVAGTSPTPVIPTVLAKGDLSKVDLLIKTYTVGKNQITDEYDWGTTSPQGDPAARALVGKKLPQERFLSSTGSVIDLARLKKPVVVVVMRGFSGQVCIYCATQTAAIANSYARFTAAGAEVVVIYPGPTEAVPAFIQAVQSLRKSPPPMPIGLDVSLLLVRGLGIEENLAKPTSMILDREGTVRYAYIGASMADRPSVEDLLKALAQVQK